MAALLALVVSASVGLLLGDEIVLFNRSEVSEDAWRGRLHVRL